MRLYQAKSSSAASATISIFATSFFGNSKKAVAFVEGRNGSNCLIYNGIGETKEDSCRKTYTFICEYNDTGEIEKYLKTTNDTRHLQMKKNTLTIV
jgi:hypothetical protein